MINIIYEELPTSIEVNNVSYPIATDFRNWIAFSDMLEDEELSKKEKLQIALEWFVDEIPVDVESAFEKLIIFFGADDIHYAPKTQVHNNASTNSIRVFSFLYDSVYILSAFKQVYNIDLRTSQMHWYEFKALLEGIPDDIPLKKRIAYRSINLSSVRNKEERKRIKKIQLGIALPQKELSAEQTGNVFG